MPLAEKWTPELATFHGFYSHGFPNCFFMGLTQGALTANFTHMLNEQSDHIAYVIKHAMDTKRGRSSLARSREGLGRHHPPHGHRQPAVPDDCTPGYYNNEGMPGERSAQNGFYGGGSPSVLRRSSRLACGGRAPGSRAALTRRG